MKAVTACWKWLKFNRPCSNFTTPSNKRLMANIQTDEALKGFFRGQD